MRILTAAVILAAASATAAFAQTERLTDIQYIAAARCRGLMQGADTAAIDAVLNANRAGRAGMVLDRAATERKAAERKARRADGPGGKAEVAREVAGACTAFTS
ncbi:MAG: hypothetical protein WC068_03390 [Caulobacter sp.]